MGVDKWIELQLHPEKIDNTALDARLAQYRTLHMSAREMAMNFPPPQVLKAVQDGKLPMPSDPYRRAIYSANLDARWKRKKRPKQNTAGLTQVAARTARHANNAATNQHALPDPPRDGRTLAAPAQCSWSSS